MLANAFFDQGDYALTSAFCDEALRLSQRGRATELAAWIRLTQSTSLYYEGRFREAIRFAELGRSIGGVTPIAARIAGSVEARSYAALGDVKEVHRAIDTAERLLSRLPSAQHGAPGRQVLTLHPADNACHAANALTLAGDIRHAAQFAADAKETLDQIGPPALRSMLRIDEAWARLQYATPDLDQACALASEALAISAWRRVDWIKTKAGDLAHAVRGLGYVGQPLEELRHNLHEWR